MPLLGQKKLLELCDAVTSVCKKRRKNGGKVAVVLEVGIYQIYIIAWQVSNFYFKV